MSPKDWTVLDLGTGMLKFWHSSEREPRLMPSWFRTESYFEPMGHGGIQKSHNVPLETREVLESLNAGKVPNLPDILLAVRANGCPTERGWDLVRDLYMGYNPGSIVRRSPPLYYHTCMNSRLSYRSFLSYTTSGMRACCCSVSSMHSHT